MLIFSYEVNFTHYIFPHQKKTRQSHNSNVILILQQSKSLLNIEQNST